MPGRSVEQAAGAMRYRRGGYRAAPMDIRAPIRAEHGFDGLYGLEITEAQRTAGPRRGRGARGAEAAAGLVHGGVYASIAESLASLGDRVGVMPEGKIAMGLVNQTSFLRPITEGTIHARARPAAPRPHDLGLGGRDHRRRGRLCVLTRMTVAVRRATRAAFSRRSGS